MRCTPEKCALDTSLIICVGSPVVIEVMTWVELSDCFEMHAAVSSEVLKVGSHSNAVIDMGLKAVQGLS